MERAELIVLCDMYEEVGIDSSELRQVADGWDAPQIKDLVAFPLSRFWLETDANRYQRGSLDGLAMLVNGRDRGGDGRSFGRPDGDCVPAAERVFAVPESGEGDVWSTSSG